MMVPYGFSNDEAGLGGAILIIAGLVFSAVTAPVLDRNKQFLLALKLLVPVIGACYLALVWMPESGSVLGPYLVLAVLGAASFALLPVALEFLAELAYPLGPE
ncbi:hypothetical protein E4U41_006058, partial [Claviceps citrina]